MKHLPAFNHANRTAAVDATTQTIRHALHRAGLNPTVMEGVNATIERALSAAGLLPGATPSPVQRPNPRHGAADGRISRILELPDAANDPASDLALPGQFVQRVFSSAVGTRRYKLYVPVGFVEHMPLIVMLHGCTQQPDDFASGTRMNELADRHGFLVAYPEQPRRANGSNCWNWFNANDQVRDGGEPALIAGITREIQFTYQIDPQRTFVAGLSAGAAMAVILGVTHSDVFSAIGVHSGLPYKAAHDVPSAFAAMKRAGHSTALLPDAARPSLPAIVFHGDRDNTVDVSNATHIVGHLITQRGADQPLTPVTEQQAAHGRDATVTVYQDSVGVHQIEQWILHGAGHAWSGGSSAGSFTDSRGPDASAEMVRFFLTLQGGTKG